MNELKPGQLKILKAVAMLLENPSAKITVSNIAAQIHVTDGAIYRHYKSKEDIFAALANYLEANLLTPLGVVQKEGGSTKQQIKKVFEQYNGFLESHPGLARMLFGQGAHEATGLADRLSLMHAKIRSQVVQILRMGQAQADLKADMSPEQATELFYGLVVATAVAQLYSFPQIPAEERWAAFVMSVFK